MTWPFKISKHFQALRVPYLLDLTAWVKTEAHSLHPNPSLKEASGFETRSVSTTAIEKQEHHADCRNTTRNSRGPQSLSQHIIHWLYFTCASLSVNSNLTDDKLQKHIKQDTVKSVFVYPLLLLCSEGGAGEWRLSNLVLTVPQWGPAAFLRRRRCAVCRQRVLLSCKTDRSRKR